MIQFPSLRFAVWPWASHLILLVLSFDQIRIIPIQFLLQEFGGSNMFIKPLKMQKSIIGMKMMRPVKLENSYVGRSEEASLQGWVTGTWHYTLDMHTQANPESQDPWRGWLLLRRPQPILEAIPPAADKRADSGAGRAQPTPWSCFCFPRGMIEAERTKGCI